jgi:hypothetical protein
VLLEDPALRLNYQRPEALPSTFVFGPDGKLKQVLQGEQTVASLAAAIGIAAAKTDSGTSSASETTSKP